MNNYRIFRHFMFVVCTLSYATVRSSQTSSSCPGQQQQAHETIRQLERANQECASIHIQLSALLQSADTQPEPAKQDDFDTIIARYSLPREVFENHAPTNNETKHMHCHEGTEIFLRKISSLLVSEGDNGICTDPIHHTTLTLEICEQRT